MTKHPDHQFSSQIQGVSNKALFAYLKELGIEVADIKEVSVVNGEVVVKFLSDGMVDTMAISKDVFNMIVSGDSAQETALDPALEINQIHFSENVNLGDSIEDEMFAFEADANQNAESLNSIQPQAGNTREGYGFQSNVDEDSNESVEAIGALGNTEEPIIENYASQTEWQEAWNAWYEIQLLNSYDEYESEYEEIELLQEEPEPVPEEEPVDIEDIIGEIDPIDIPEIIVEDIAEPLDEEVIEDLQGENPDPGLVEPVEEPKEEEQQNPQGPQGGQQPPAQPPVQGPVGNPIGNGNGGGIGGAIGGGGPIIIDIPNPTIPTGNPSSPGQPDNQNTDPDDDNGQEESNGEEENNGNNGPEQGENGSGEEPNGPNIPITHVTDPVINDSNNPQADLDQDGGVLQGDNEDNTDEQNVVNGSDDEPTMNEGNVDTPTGDAGVDTDANTDTTNPEGDTNTVNESGDNTTSDEQNNDESTSDDIAGSNDVDPTTTTGSENTNDDGLDAQTPGTGGAQVIGDEDNFVSQDVISTSAVDETDEAPSVSTTIDFAEHAYFQDNPELIETVRVRGAELETFTVEGMASDSLKSEGQDVTVTTHSKSGGVSGYTGTRADGEKVFELDITTEGDYTFNTYHVLDHGDVNSVNEAITMNFGVLIVSGEFQNSEGISTYGVLDSHIRVQWLDDGPVTEVVHLNAVEPGESITENLMEYADIGNDDTQSGVFSVQGEEIINGSITIQGHSGSLNVSQNGVLSYTAYDLPAGGADVFSYVIYDGDGDRVESSVTFDVLNAYDEDGNLLYPDENGEAYFLDDSGNHVYRDANNDTYFLNDDGHSVYQDDDFNYYYTDENGNRIDVDGAGNPFDVVDNDNDNGNTVDNGEDTGTDNGTDTDNATGGDTTGGSNTDTDTDTGSNTDTNTDNDNTGNTGNENAGGSSQDQGGDSTTGGDQGSSGQDTTDQGNTDSQNDGSDTGEQTTDQDDTAEPLPPIEVSDTAVIRDVDEYAARERSGADELFLEGNILEDLNLADDTYTDFGIERPTHKVLAIVDPSTGAVLDAGSHIQLEQGDFYMDAEGRYTFRPNSGLTEDDLDLQEIQFVLYNNETDGQIVETLVLNNTDVVTLRDDSNYQLTHGETIDDNVFDNDLNSNDAELKTITFDGETKTFDTETSHTFDTDAGQLVINKDGSYVFSTSSNANASAEFSYTYQDTVDGYSKQSASLVFGLDAGDVLDSVELSINNNNRDYNESGNLYDDVGADASEFGDITSVKIDYIDPYSGKSSTTQLEAVKNLDGDILYFKGNDDPYRTNSLRDVDIRVELNGDYTIEGSKYNFKPNEIRFTADKINGEEGKLTLPVTYFDDVEVLDTDANNDIDDNRSVEFSLKEVDGEQVVVGRIELPEDMTADGMPVFMETNPFVATGEKNNTLTSNGMRVDVEVDAAGQYGTPGSTIVGTRSDGVEVFKISLQQNGDYIYEHGGVALDHAGRELDLRFNIEIPREGRSPLRTSIVAELEDSAPEVSPYGEIESSPYHLPSLFDGIRMVGDNDESTILVGRNEINRETSDSLFVKELFVNNERVTLQDHGGVKTGRTPLGLITINEDGGYFFNAGYRPPFNMAGWSFESYEQSGFITEYTYTFTGDVPIRAVISDSDGDTVQINTSYEVNTTYTTTSPIAGIRTPDVPNTPNQGGNDDYDGGYGYDNPYDIPTDDGSNYSGNPYNNGNTSNGGSGNGGTSGNSGGNGSSSSSSVEYLSTVNQIGDISDTIPSQSITQTGRIVTGAHSVGAALVDEDMTTFSIFPASNTNNVLTSNGDIIRLRDISIENGVRTIEGYAGGRKVLSLEVDYQGNYTLKAFDSIDHNGASGLSVTIRAAIDMPNNRTDYSADIDFRWADSDVFARDDVDLASASGREISGSVVDNDDFGSEGVGSVKVAGIKPSFGNEQGIPRGESTTVQGEYGQLTIFSDGTYNYHATDSSISENEIDTFTYTIIDRDGSRDTGKLEIEVVPFDGSAFDGIFLGEFYEPEETISGVVHEIGRQFGHSDFGELEGVQIDPNNAVRALDSRGKPVELRTESGEPITLLLQGDSVDQTNANIIGRMPDGELALYFNPSLVGEQIFDFKLYTNLDHNTDFGRSPHLTIEFGITAIDPMGNRVPTVVAVQINEASNLEEEGYVEGSGGKYIYVGKNGEATRQNDNEDDDTNPEGDVVSENETFSEDDFDYNYTNQFTGDDENSEGDNDGGYADSYPIDASQDQIIANANQLSYTKNVLGNDSVSGTGAHVSDVGYYSGYITNPTLSGHDRVGSFGTHEYHWGTADMASDGTLSINVTDPSKVPEGEFTLLNYTVRNNEGGSDSTTVKVDLSALKDDGGAYGQDNGFYGQNDLTWNNGNDDYSHANSGSEWNGVVSNDQYGQTSSDYAMSDSFNDSVAALNHNDILSDGDNDDALSSLNRYDQGQTDAMQHYQQEFTHMVDQLTQVYGSESAALEHMQQQGYLDHFSQFGVGV